MREDIKDPRKLDAKADEIWQSASSRSVNVVSTASPSSPLVQDEADVNASLPALLLMLLLVLLHMLSILLLSPPTITLTSAGTIVTTEIRLNPAVPLAPGFQETSWLADGSCSSC